MRRLAVYGFVVAVPSWLVLAAAAGNAGLQRSIGGAWTLLTERPAAGLGATAVSLVLAFAAWPIVRRRSPLAGVHAVLGWNVVAGVVLAPIAIGELEPVHAPLVIGATTVCGLTLLAAWAGAWLRSWVVARANAGGREGPRPG